MKKKLARTGNSLALVLDKPLLEQLGIDEDTELEISPTEVSCAGLFRRLSE